MIEFFCGIWNYFETNHEIMTAVVLFLTLLIVLWYTIETRKARQIAQQQLNLEKLKDEPNIISYFDNGDSIRKILLVLRNEGRNIVHEIKAKIIPELDIRDSTFNEYFNKNALFNEGITIGPNGTYKIYVIKISSELRKLFENHEIITEYKIEIEYKNSVGQTEKRQFPQSLAQFFFRLDPEGKTPIEKQLEEINKHLSSIASAIQNHNGSEENTRL